MKKIQVIFGNISIDITTTTDSKEDELKAKMLAKLLKKPKYANKIKANFKNYIINTIIPEIKNDLTIHEVALQKIPRRKDEKNHPQT